MKIEKDLIKAGLPGNEAKIYATLLKTGEISANKLAKEKSMDRTLTYQVLNNLIEKGLVIHIKKTGKRYFRATNPKNLLNPIKEKQLFIKELIPKLEEIKKEESIPFDINIFEGREGLRSVMKEIIQEKEGCGFGSTGKTYDLFYEAPHWTKIMKKNKAKIRLIMAKKSKDHKITTLSFIKTKTLGFDTETTTLIYGDKVSIFLPKQKLRVIVIKNRLLAEDYKKHFEILWGAAE